MKKHEVDRLIAVIKELEDDRPVPAKASLDRPLMTRVTSANGADHPGKGLGDPVPAPSAAAVDSEVQYQKFKRRLLEELRVDPVFVKLLATQGEILVEIEPRIVELDGSSLKGRIARLMAAGWFKEARKSGTVRGELARTGSDPGSGGRLSEALSEFVLQGFLTREGDGFLLAPGVKVSEKVIEAR